MACRNRTVQRSSSLRCPGGRTRQPYCRPPIGLVPIGLALLCLGCTGEPGPMGPPGPPGRVIRTGAYLACFDAPDDVSGWLFGSGGTWQVTDGRLVLQSLQRASLAVGPSTGFSHDLDITVRVTAIIANDSTQCGIRFHVNEAGAYQLGVDRSGLCVLSWYDERGGTGVLFQCTLDSGLPEQLRVVRQGSQIRAYGDGRVIGTATDAVLNEGHIQVYLRGQGRIAFDDLRVGTTLLLE
jgi:hypothetical protein